MKRLGQNFLTSYAIARRIAEAADIGPSDTILEIGPGKGILTEAILEKNPKKLIAVEKDKRFIGLLRDKFSEVGNLEIVEGDMLEVLNSKLPSTNYKPAKGEVRQGRQIPNSKFKLLNTNYKIVANIPYYITSRLLRLIFSQKNPPERVTLMIQKEVAERICAKPPRMNLLALSVQVYGKPKIAFRVSRQFFKPAPKVDSAVIVLDNISRGFFREKKASPFNKRRRLFSEKEFFCLLHAGFRQKRKMLLKNLKNSEIGFINLTGIFKKCRISEKARAENLALEDWRCLMSAPKDKI